jgi:ADP-ribosylation factor-like protein 8
MNVPTVGFDMLKFKKGKVSIKVWDLGGQQKFRPMWEKYCRGVDTIVFVVDAADEKMVQIAKKELHDLLHRPSLAHIPLMVLLNKNDLLEADNADKLSRDLELSTIADRDVVYYSISCKNVTNIEATMDWLIKRAKK